MRLAIAVFISVTLAAIVTGCAPKVTVFDEAAERQLLGQAGLGVYWKVNLELEPGETVSRLYLLDGTLYCLTSRNRLMAVDAARGLWRWTLSAAEVDNRVFCLIHLNSFVVPGYLARGFPDRPGLEVLATDRPFDALLLNTFTYVLVADRATGKPALKVPLDFAATTGGAVAEDAFGRTLYYVMSADNRCHALDLSRALDLWSADMGAPVRAAPVVYGGVLFVADANGLLRAGLAQPIDPRPLWNSNQIDSQAMHGAVTAEMHVDERGCFVPCEDNRLYAFDRQSGKGLWPPVVCQGPLRQSPQVGDNTLFQYALRDQLYAIDVATGVRRWAMPTGRLVLGIVQDRGSQVTVLDASGGLRIVEELTGQELASVPVLAYDVCLPNVTAPAVYAATRTGRVVCIRPVAAGNLTLEMLRGRP